MALGIAHWQSECIDIGGAAMFALLCGRLCNPRMLTNVIKKLLGQVKREGNGDGAVGGNSGKLGESRGLRKCLSAAMDPP